MSISIICREQEQLNLASFFYSKCPEFLAIYGRRRIGKTFLIRQFFKNKNAIFFNSTGTQKGSLSEQIKNFTRHIGDIFHGGIEPSPQKNWNDTFYLLTKSIKNIPENKKIILFFDEFPWMATKNSKLLSQLDYYWNQYWSNDNRIKLIICGSSASWIIDKIVNNKGGLHNRLTHNIHLEPFNLKETQIYLRKMNIKLSKDQILQIYMATGGVPYYLSKIEKGLSATQNIEKLAFSKKGFLLQEFDNLFASLFDDHESHITIIREIANHRYGIGQAELLKKMGKHLQGKGGIKKLKILENSSFIMSFKPLYHKKKGIYYKVIDEYTLFYFYWIEPIKETLLAKDLSTGYWEKIKGSPSWYSFSGYTFEAICYKHIQKIRLALKLNSSAIPNTWRYIPKPGSQEEGAQVDLLFDRDDDSITICEIKYTNASYCINKEEAKKLEKKILVFKDQTQTKKQIFLSIISANGLKETDYSEDLVDGGVVTLENLFQ